MISHNRSRNTKPRNNVIEQKQSYSVHIIRISWHCLHSLSEIINGHDDVVMTDDRRSVARSKINAALGKGADGDNRVEWSGMNAHFL